VEGLRTPDLAGASETAYHLVGDQQDVVTAKDRLDLREIRSRWHDNAARAHDRLRKHRRDGVRAFAENQRVQVLGEAGRELLLALAL
jgi:hypothetical protein